MGVRIGFRAGPIWVSIPLGPEGPPTRGEELVYLSVGITTAILAVIGFADVWMPVLATVAGFCPTILVAIGKLLAALFVIALVLFPIGLGIASRYVK